MAVVPEHQAPPAHRHTDQPIAFRCDVLQVGDRAVIVARGEVDLATASVLRREMDAALDLPVTGLTVDLSYVTFLDSSGVHALVTSRRNAEHRSINFRLESVPRQARAVLEVCDLLEYFGLGVRSDAFVPPTIGDTAA